jgi:5-formyltetrahydrofolate cyclo-ligase
MENNDIFHQKSELRRKMRKLKQELSDGDKILKSGRLFASVYRHPAFKNAKVVMMYWSLPDEVQTHQFVEEISKTKKVILPVVAGDELELREYRGQEYMKSDNTMGIGEPVGDPFENTGEIDLIIVPGVAFDRSNNRMGRGKAYYDRLLKKVNAYKIGVCFDFQFLDEIPSDENDVKMDEVLRA